MFFIDYFKRKNSLFNKDESFIWFIKRDLKRFTFRIKRLIDFIKIGYNDYDWGYDYLLDIEKYKLKKMSQYFHKSKIAEGNEERARSIDFALHLLEITIDDPDLIKTTGELKFKKIEGDRGLTEIDSSDVKHKFLKHVNTRNAKRFLNAHNVKILKEGDNDNLKEIIKEHLYKQKIWHLYNLIREYKMQEWWD